MKDSDFITFQDDFYNLLTKYGVKNIDGDHKDFDKICDKRNNIADFIDELKKDKEDIPIETLEKMAKDTDLLLSDNLINFARLVQNKP